MLNFSFGMSMACAVEFYSKRLGCWYFEDLRGSEGFRVVKGYVEIRIKGHRFGDEASWMRFRV